MDITEKTRMKDLLHQSGSIAKVFKKYRLDCMSCRGVTEDTVGQIAQNNGLDVKELIKELKESLK